MKKRLLSFFLCLFLCALFSTTFAANLKTDYPLEQMLIYGRHHLRAPLNIGKDSVLYKITTHTWKKHSEKSGELSSKGGELEVLMGQYFRKRLEDEKFIPENYVPKQGEVRFYANSVQRTAATAKYFSAGFLPVANIETEHKPISGKMDIPFNFHYKDFPTDAAFKNGVKKEIGALNANLLAENMKAEVALLENVLDFKNSAYAKENNTESFLLNGKEYFTVAVDTALHLGGSIRPAMSAADALVLEFLESSDNSASFGKKLSFSEWQSLGRLKELGVYTVFHIPTLSKEATKPMLKLMKDEFSEKSRKFTFLCGHDLHIAATLSALGVEDYKTVNAVEFMVPIGGAFVIEKRRGKDGRAYANLMLIYQSAEQIRNKEALSLENPPMITPLSLKGLQKNSDGLYLFDDVIKRITEIAGN